MSHDDVVPLRPRHPRRGLAAETRAPARPDPEPLWREAVGRELRAARLEQRRTLADVAEHSGVSLQYLSEVERGLKDASSEILGAVSGALGLRLVDLTVRVSRTIASGARSVGGGAVCLAA